MKPKFIPVEESFAQWQKDPKYVAEYDALEEEFVLASAMIKARSDADMTQEQVAEAMGTTQAVVARLESGKVRPSTRTLERFAKATRTRLRISFFHPGGEELSLGTPVIRGK
jgi:ribosome-binding protein aMBF1 (putative translation factor)